MWQATPAQLALFRQEVDYNPDGLKQIIEADDFRAYFPEISGEMTKTAPKGYSADHPDIDLLKRKQFFFMHRYTDKEVLKASFANEVLRGCRQVKPYCDFLNELFFEHETQAVRG
jgi:uncharacterized protein (DUF2461 family)